jgi:hypothetical protein
MEIQWIIFAKGIAENKIDHTFNILGIYEHVNMYMFPDKKCTVWLIAKVKPEIVEVGEVKDIEIDISNIENKWNLKRYIKYKVHDLKTLVDKIPYIVIPLRDLELQYSGEYVFKIIVDGKYKNEESLNVTV